ncbi:MAG: AMP-binding protein [Pseudomonadota bacterium]
MTPVASRLDVDRISDRNIDGQDEPRTAFDLLRRSAERWPGRAALYFLADPARIERARTLTFEDLFEQVCAAATLFQTHGVDAADVVAVALSNRPEAHIAIWGAQSVATVMPINGGIPTADFAALLALAKTRILVADAGSWANRADEITAACPRLTNVFLVGEAAAHAHPDVDVQDFNIAMSGIRGDLAQAPPPPEHLGIINCTAGTTGRPRLVRRSLAAEMRTVCALRPMFGDLLNEGTVVAGGLPLFHNSVAAASGLLPWSQGACVITAGPRGFLNPDFVKNYWRMIAHYRVTLALLVPAVIAQLLRVPIGEADITTLSLAISGGARLSAALQRRFERAAGVRLLSSYGIVELGCLATMTPPAGERRAGSAGIALPWHRTRVAMFDDANRFQGDCDIEEVGRLLVNGPGLLETYIDDDRGDVAWVECGDGLLWLDTGDLASIDGDGYHWIAGRRSEVIRRGGRYVDPSTIEEALLQHPMVAMAAAVARPDPVAGEVPVAYAVLREGGQSDTEALREFLRDTLTASSTDLPVDVLIVDALPLTPLGKVDKRALQQREACVAMASIKQSLGDAANTDDATD